MVLSVEEQVEKASLELPQVDCPVRHIFGPGMCIREMTMPVGILVLGHKHRYASMNIMLKGKLAIIQGDGTQTILEAPQTFVSPPGRKAAYILEEVIWQNVFATTETDVSKIEEMFLDKTNFSLTRDKELVSKQADIYQRDRDDYTELLKELNTTEEILRSIVDDMTDHIDLPYGSYKFQLGDSPIQGKGIFSTFPINTEELIGPVRIGGKRTILGRRINHAVPPNCIMVLNGDVVNLYACHDIHGSNGCDLGEELTVDYRFTLNTINSAHELLLIKEFLCQQD